MSSVVAFLKFNMQYTCICSELVAIKKLYRLNKLIVIHVASNKDYYYKLLFVCVDA